MDKVHLPGKAAVETAVGSPVKAVEMAWTCVEGADIQQRTR